MQRKFTVFFILALVVAVVLVACTGVTAPSAGSTAAPAGEAAASGGVINVWTDGDTNISDWLANKVAPAFEKAYPQYTVKVTTVRGVGNGVADIMQRALAAMQTGDDPQAEVFDANPNSYPDLIKAGLFEKLSEENIPNAANVVDAAFLNEYTMSYRGSQVLLAYDSSKVPENEVPKTFADLIEWVKAHPGQFVYCRPDKGGSGGNFVVRAIYEVTGKDPSLFKPVGTDEAPDADLLSKFPDAWTLLSSINEDIYDNGAYPAGNNPVLQLLANGSVSMATVWSDQSLQALSQGVLPDTIKLTQFTDLPMPGGYSPFSVPSNAKNKQGALDFVNFMLTVEEQTSVVQDIGGFPAIDWSMLPADLQQQYTGVITTNVPSWPGGPWDAERNKGWYENVATDIDPGS
jgi:putative spermidine/putrescine transport system substrate-binding protein